MNIWPNLSEREIESDCKSHFKCYCLQCCSSKVTFYRLYKYSESIPDTWQKTRHDLFFWADLSTVISLGIRALFFSWSQLFMRVGWTNAFRSENNSNQKKYQSSICKNYDSNRYNRARILWNRGAIFLCGSSGDDGGGDCIPRWLRAISIKVVV